MILDITFTDRGPIQLQQVSRTRIFTKSDVLPGGEVSQPFMEIYFGYKRPMIDVPLSQVQTIDVSND